MLPPRTAHAPRRRSAFHRLRRPRGCLPPGVRSAGVAAAPVALVAAGLSATTTQAAQANPPTTGGILTSWGASWNGPTDVPPSLADKTLTAIASGGNQGLALSTDGHITAWGSNWPGETTVTDSLAVTRPQVTLGVTAPGGLRPAGRSLPVKVRGLEAGEHYSITTGGVEVTTGTAGPRGDFTRSVMVPPAPVRVRSG